MSDDEDIGPAIGRYLETLGVFDLPPRRRTVDGIISVISETRYNLGLKAGDPNADENDTGVGLLDAIKSYFVFYSRKVPMERRDDFTAEALVEGAATLYTDDDIGFPGVQALLGMSLHEFTDYRLHYLRERVINRGHLAEVLDPFFEVHSHIFGTSKVDFTFSRRAFNLDLRTIQSYATAAKPLHEAESIDRSTAVNIMAGLPLSRGRDRVELMKRYAKVVGKTIDEGDSYTPIQQGLLNPDNLDLIVDRLSNHYWVDMVLNSIAGSPASPTGAIFASPAYIRLDDDCPTESMGYNYRAIEIGLLQREMPTIVDKIVRENKRTRNFYVTDLGVGEDKFQELVDPLSQARGKSVKRINLVDQNPQRLERATTYLRRRYKSTRVKDYFSRFQDIKFGIPRGKKGIAVTSFLGKSFANERDPTANFDAFRKTGAQYVIVGLYHNPQPDDLESHIKSYSTPAFQGLAAIAAKFWGLTEEDITDRCTFEANIENIDMSGKYGPKFKQVKVVHPHFVTKDNIETELFNYPAGHGIPGLMSIDYTPEQFKLLAKHHKFKVMHEKHDGEVGVYLLKDLQHPSN